MVSDLRTFVYKVCKISLQKRGCFFGKYSLTSSIVFGIGATIRIGLEMLCLPYAGFLDISLEEENTIWLWLNNSLNKPFLGISMNILPLFSAELIYFSNTHVPIIISYFLVHLKWSPTLW